MWIVHEVHTSICGYGSLSHTHTQCLESYNNAKLRWKLDVAVSLYKSHCCFFPTSTFFYNLCIFFFNCKGLNPFFTVPSSSLTCLVFKDGQEQLKTNKNRMHTSKKFQNLLSHISARYPFGKKISDPPRYAQRLHQIACLTVWITPLNIFEIPVPVGRQIVSPRSPIPLCFSVHCRIVPASFDLYSVT